MTFVDCVQIKLASGKGGRGAVHFQRTRRSPRAGPDGGDGGRGGDLILFPKTSLRDFSHLTGRTAYKADDGKPGNGGKKKGAKGKDLILYVPEGTRCCDLNGQLLKEIKGKAWCVLKGGKGGKGNHYFKTARFQAPQIAQPGGPSLQKEVILDLKWVSDVCFIGFRGCGKTSLALKLSRREEKIYPSSYPRLFSVCQSGDLILLVDLPGISSSTKRFLKQAERTKIIILVISLTDKDPFASYQKLKKDILSYDKQYQSNLAHKLSFLLLMGKKDSVSVQKVKSFYEDSIKKISFFSMEDPEKVKTLMDEILKELVTGTVLDKEKIKP